MATLPLLGVDVLSRKELKRAKRRRAEEAREGAGLAWMTPAHEKAKTAAVAAAPAPERADDNDAAAPASQSQQQPQQPLSLDDALRELRTPKPCVVTFGERCLLRIEPTPPPGRAPLHPLRCSVCSMMFPTVRGADAATLTELERFKSSVAGMFAAEGHILVAVERAGNSGRGLFHVDCYPVPRDWLSPSALGSLFKHAMNEEAERVGTGGGVGEEDDAGVSAQVIDASTKPSLANAIPDGFRYLHVEVRHGNSSSQSAANRVSLVFVVQTSNFAWDLPLDVMQAARPDDVDEVYFSVLPDGERRKQFLTKFTPFDWTRDLDS